MSRTRAVAAATLATLSLSASALAARTVTRTDRQSGKATSVKVGDTLVLRLQSCTGSCGYSWTFKAKPSTKVLKQVYRKLVAPQQADGMVGASETLVVKYRVVGKGATKLALSYDGPSGQHDKNFRLTVTAR